MKRVLVYTCSVILLLQPLAIAHADTATSTERILQKQVAAIGDYIERTFLPRTDTPLSEETLRTIILDAATWFQHAQEENGHFRYEYVPYENRCLDDDNIVRQAGALYVLGEIERRDEQHAASLDDTVESAIAHFESLSRTDTENERTFRCITGSRASTRCTLGTTALALAGILGYIERHPEKESMYTELIDDYRNYLLAMDKTDGGFRNVHRIKGSRRNLSESPYSNGEALLALARLYAYEPNDEVRQALESNFTYLADQPFDSALYLWMMAALVDMHEHLKNNAYITYAKEYTDWRIGRFARYRGTDRNVCAYTEGVASAYTLLRSHISAPEQTALEREIDYWNRKDSTLQLDEDDLYRVIPGADGLSLEMLENPRAALGGFLTAEDEPTQRIDFTQHCASAYLQTLVDRMGSTL